MLKQRVMTAVVLILLFIGTLFYTSPPVFCLATLAITLWGVWEWTLLMGLRKIGHRMTYLIFMLAVMLGIFYVPIPITWCVYFFYAVLFFWLLTIPLLKLYPRALFWKQSMLFQAAVGMFVLIPGWFAINFIRDVDARGQYLLLFIFVLVWGADIAAYFAGRRFGRKLLLPQVSPGKTWVGVYAAIITGMLITMVPLLYFKVPYYIWPYTLTLSVVTILFSIVGDLLESMFKRSEGLKDSGSFLPGHGGLLDRIDSLTAAVPIFTLGAIILSKMNG